MSQQAQNARTELNGVDTARLFETIDAINSEPKIANFCFRADNHWIDGALNRTRIGSFYGASETQVRAKPFVLDKDEHPVLLGTDTAPNPVEYVLAALAGCLTTSLVYHAAARGIRVEEVESSYEGDLDLHGFLGLSEEVRNGYEQIRVKFRVKADATDEQIAELVELARKRSPVFDIVSQPVPVKVELDQ